MKMPPGQTRPFVCFTIAVMLLLCFLSCSKTSMLNPLPYQPVITMNGFFESGDQFSWPGNRSNHNSCKMSGDTMMMMYFYSEDYQQSPPKGDQLRLDVFFVDSGGFITTHGALFHLSRYSTGPTNLTYEVVPGDTVLDRYKVSMKAESFSMQSGARVSLTDIGITPRVLGQGTLPLAIVKGTIIGAVE
jgi:hypothetical protein